MFAVRWTVEGDQQTRRQIFQALGVSFALTGRDLRIERHPLLEFLGEHREALNALTAAEQASLLEKTDLGEFEPSKTGFGSTKKTPFSTFVSFGGKDRTFTELCCALLACARGLPDIFPAIPSRL